MIKLCGKSIVYPLKLIFEAFLQGGKLAGNIQNFCGRHIF